jgi:hypothetical protein
VAFSKKKSGSETRKRAPIIGFRAKEEERAQIEAAASKAGLTVGSYVRSCALKKPTTRAVRRPSVETAELARLLGHLGLVGGMVQQFASLPETGASLLPGALDETLHEFRQAARAILLTLGKRPA